MVNITLSRGQVAIVDDEDVALLSQFKWHAQWAKLTNSHYAECWVYQPYKYREVMHRMIMGLSRGDGKQVDHINGDTLDNRKVNLRLVNHSQNQMNRKMQCPWSSSGIRGVSYCKKTGLWKARVNHQGKEIWLGRFLSKEMAALAAHRARLEAYGEYARSA